MKFKLDAHSVKYVLVGYTDNGYKLYNKKIHSIIMSCNMIFDKETGHRSLTILDSSNDLLSDVHSVANTLIPGMLTTCQPITLHICNTDGLLYEDYTIPIPIMASSQII